MGELVCTADTVCEFGEFVRSVALTPVDCPFAMSAGDDCKNTQQTEEQRNHEGTQFAGTEYGVRLSASAWRYDSAEEVTRAFEQRIATKDVAHMACTTALCNIT